MRTSSPPCTLSRGRGALPSTCTAPDSIQLLRSAREYCGRARARARSKSTPAVLYKRARHDLDANDFNAAIKIYEQLTARFPFTDEARQSRLDLIYAYYRAGEGESATDAAETFIRENPTHPRVDYAYYIEGLVD